MGARRHSIARSWLRRELSAPSPLAIEASASRRRVRRAEFPKPLFVFDCPLLLSQARRRAVQTLIVVRARALVAARRQVMRLRHDQSTNVIREALAEVLEELGYVVCAVEANGANAVTAAGRYCPDLMLVDVGLGEASGVAAVEEILRCGFVRHVFVTGDVLGDLSLAPGRSPHSKALPRVRHR